MNPPLDNLHRKLSRLGRMRRCGRSVAGTSTLVTALLWALAAVFIIDVVFEMDAMQRFTVFCLAAAGVLWAIVRFVRPCLAGRETEVDLALLVEKHHGIDSDLVAAIEFASPDAVSWGSATLRSAVIGTVAARGETLRLSELVNFREPALRAQILLVSAVIWVSLAVLFPKHFATFMSRLALGDAHYPARTVIDRIEINGRAVLTSAGASTPRPTRCAEGQSVEIVVRCARRPPATGELVLWDVDRGVKRRIRLTPLDRDGRPSNDARTATRFVGRLPALVDALHYQVFLGDAWTNPATIEMVSRPEVEVHCEVRLPEYAGPRAGTWTLHDAHHVTVLEGSHVRLAVSCVNRKQLATAWANLRTVAGASRREMTHRTADDGAWLWVDGASDPLKNMRHDVQFDIDVTDEDGLRPLRIPSGTIRVQADALPQGAATTIHRVVVPAAKPTIRYRVTDDFGIGNIRLQVEVTRRQEGDRAAGDNDRQREVYWLDPGDVDLPLRAPALPATGRLSCDLERWQLAKGDRLKLTLETTDYRGSRPGQGALSKTLDLIVSDEADVLAAILEADKRTEKALDEMIDRQAAAAAAPRIATRRRMQREMVGAVGRLVADVLDVQIEQLMENRLETLPVFGDIQLMRANLKKVAEEDMRGIVELLSFAQRATQERQATFTRQARDKARDVIALLMAERERLRRRLKVSHLNAQLQQLISKQERVRAETRALAEVAEDRRDARTLATLEGQRDAHSLYNQLLRSLETIEAWDTSQGEAAAENRAQLTEHGVDRHLDQAESSLAAFRLTDADKNQTDVLDELRKVVARQRASQGLRRLERSSAFAAIDRLLSAQELLIEATKRVDAGAQDELDTLSRRQHDMARQIGELKGPGLDEPSANDLLQRAETAALQAESDLFEGEKAAAIVNQQAVVGKLGRLKELLERSRNEAGQIAQLEQLEKALEALEGRQEDVIGDTDSSPARAERGQQKVATDLAAEAGRKPLPESVQSRVRSAAATADRAAQTMRNHAADASQARGAAAREVQAALRAARAEAGARLQAARGQQRKDGRRRSARSAGRSDQITRPGPGQTDSPADASKAAKDARRDGRRRSASESVDRNALTSQRSVGDGPLEKGPREAIPGRSFIDAPWFARLPAEVREAIRVRARRRPPRGYEERLRRYFESVDR